MVQPRSHQSVAFLGPAQSNAAHDATPSTTMPRNRLSLVVWMPCIFGTQAGYQCWLVDSNGALCRKGVGMNKDFQARLARLEAKHTDLNEVASPHPVTVANHAPRTNYGRDKKHAAGHSMAKMALIATAFLILLPTGAVLVTVYMP